MLKKMIEGFKLIDTEKELNISINEWQKIDPDSETRLKNFRFKQSSSDQLISQLSTVGYIDLLELPSGLTIKTYHYVGRIEIENLRISIHPKISGLPLLNLLRYAYKLRKLDLFHSLSYGTEKSNFLDLLIYQLILEVNELIHRGLLRNYVKVDESLQSPRGKIQFSDIAKKGGINEPYLLCNTFLRIEDNFLNQAVLAGLNFATRLTSDIELKSSLRRTAKILNQKVRDIPLSQKLINSAQISINRLTVSYQPSITLIKKLYESVGPSFLQNQVQIKIPGFLFDMNLFFQELIGRFLRENLVDHTLREQYQLKRMLSYNPKHNPQFKKSYSPRPDFAILDGKKVVVLLDTKYRDVWEMDLPADMLYQLSFYAISQGLSGQATIIYPTMNEIASEEWIDISHPISQDHMATVKLRPINLFQLEKIIYQESDKQKKSFAHYIAFGK